MKGVVFTEFMDMVAERYGYETLDEVLAGAKLPHNGAYTAVGTYPHTEIVALVVSLSSKVGSPPDALVRAFGRHLFGRFAELYPVFFQDVPDALTFLERVDSVIHVEVRKLYPDAELPRFQASRRADGGLNLLYLSSRHFADLAEGLIEGCAEHFKQPLMVQRRNQPVADGSAGSAVMFHVSPASGVAASPARVAA